MKYLSQLIQEKLKVNSKSKVNQYNYQPKDLTELKEIIKDLINERGYDADLNDIDVSQITDMSFLFSSGKLLNFDGNISDWDVSNVKDMSHMFCQSDFSGKNGDISEWDVSNVTNMNKMFWMSQYNGDISKWDVSNVKRMKDMFKNCPLEKNPPAWYKK